MIIDDRVRRQMYQDLEQAIGARSAEALMAHLPPVGWADVATKRDLDALRGELRAEVANLGRTVIFTNIACMIGVGGLVLAAAQLA
ncbi:MAG: hypothetical protein H0V95_13145 [Actinobacteria bacterium]|nr:hypothetical protein [Actinomycetota bacterium]